MRKSVLLVLLFSLTLSPTIIIAENSYQVEIHKYNDHLYKLSTQYSLPFNNLLYVGEESLLLVDTGFDRTPESILKAIRTISDLPIEHVIISHTHTDHIGGLDVLGKDAVVFVHKNGIWSEFLELEPYRKIKQHTVSISDTMEFYFEDELIRMIPLPKGHATDEMLIHFVNSNVLYTGSRVLPGNYIYIEQEDGGTIDEVLNRIKLIAEEYKNLIIVPAHYYDMNYNSLISYHQTLVATKNEVDRHLDMGKSVDQIIKEKVLEPWDSLGQSYYGHAEWIKAIAYERGIGKNETPSIYEPMVKALVDEGLKSMTSTYYDLKKNNGDEYNFDIYQLYGLGYELLYRDRIDDALEVFRLNMEAFPESKYVYRCYGDVLVMKGKKKKALKIYDKALEIDPEYQLVLDSVKRLKG